MSNDDFTEVLKSLIPDYLANRKNELQELKQLLKQGKLVEIKKIGHKLAGNAGGYGLHELGQIGAKIEESQTIEEVQTNINHYENELKRLLSI